jgi:NAD(P)-dependent dehydrogenase (short-subunit alcohol dehydrogenase family)
MCPESVDSSGSNQEKETAVTNSLKGKVEIITGTGRGIGAAIARRFAAEGARVVVNYSRNSEEAAGVVAEVTSANGEAVSVWGDVSRKQDCAALFDAAEKAFGQPDILVNNAGLILYKPLAAVTEEEYDRLFAVNVKGSFLTCQLAASRLKSNGVIINVSSSTTALALPTYEIVLVGLFLNTPGTGLIINISSPGRFAANESSRSSRRSGGARSDRVTGQLIGVGSNIEYDA